MEKGRPMHLDRTVEEQEEDEVDRWNCATVQRLQHSQREFSLLPRHLMTERRRLESRGDSVIAAPYD